MTKRFGFTLAEVLITLGIIGVVAAMTIPNLIANTNGAKFRSQFKKSVSTLSQAGLMAQAQYDFDYAGTNAACTTGTGENPESVMTFCSILNGTLTGQSYLGAMNTIQRSVNGTATDYKIVADSIGISTDGAAANSADYLAYSLADGSIVAFKKTASNCELGLGQQVTNAAITGTGSLINCLGFIDVNGTTLPNKEVTCSGVVTTGKNTAGKASLNPDYPCVVKNDAAHMTDIFPVVFHDATVEPATDAAKYVLTSSK